MRREIMRLEASLNAAGEREKLVFLHYPPIYQKYECPEILELLEKHRVRLCCYGHIHGKGIYAAFNGWRGCTEFRCLAPTRWISPGEDPGLRKKRKPVFQELKVIDFTRIYLLS